MKESDNDGKKDGGKERGEGGKTERGNGEGAGGDDLGSSANHPESEFWQELL